ncbi:MAG TPA: hypothetical protein ENN87_15770 [Phycisphaerales bacterium]|nr:hypothetical protein [Phycisphaerales bacterium]
MNPQDLEKYSSAITLSDMEVFVFPELMYSLVLANIMSPLIWRWREEDCFRRLAGKSPYKRLMRLKQYIMDEFEFNLDLNTWGLTHKDVEIARFSPFLSPEAIARSNALFGYEGDQYYFDVDIRRHFGLDQYEGDVIPYWKTETVEAMAAFRLKEGYKTGAGECVSLSTLYAAAAFVVCGIPLEDIFLVLTPLHSQNFIDISDGVLTNNRRLVTKSMWFNGTEISNKAQRALRNEQVTIVAHPTGYVHCLYEQATIDPAAYERFRDRLAAYLSADLDALMFANFLRTHQEYHRYFQFCRHSRGRAMFVKAEVLYKYEHGSPYRIADHTFDKLLDEVSGDDYSVSKCIDRLCAEQMMAFIRYEKIDIHRAEDRRRLATYVKAFIPDAEAFAEKLYAFIHLEPRLPDSDKQYLKTPPIQVDPEMDRQQIIEAIEALRPHNPTADLAFYAYRDMTRCRWEPFIKAALERNPVSVEHFAQRPLSQVVEALRGMPDQSIYDGPRLAQPDEVVNFGAGDGVEKAITLANVIHARRPQARLDLDIEPNQAVVRTDDAAYAFASTKGLRHRMPLGPGADEA